MSEKILFEKTGINFLLNEKRPLALHELEEVLKGPWEFADLKPWVLFSDERYARNIIFKNENFEVLCICWKPGQSSTIHDHADSQCAAKVIQGTCRESFYECKDISSHCATPVKTEDYNPGVIMGSGPTDIHRIQNLGTESLVTLHIYSPPLAKYTEFEEA